MNQHHPNNKTTSFATVIDPMRCITKLFLWTLCCTCALSHNLRSSGNEYDEHKTLPLVDDTTTTAKEQQHHHANNNNIRQTQAVDIDTLIASFQQAREQFTTRLKNEYGEDNYQAMFVDQHPNATDTTTSIGRNAFYKGTSNAATAWNRTIRKLMIRILQYLVQGLVKDYVWATA